MHSRRLAVGLNLLVVFLAAVSPAAGLANRVFVSARSGNNANSCDNIATPCLTFQGAIVQLNPGGEAIVLDSGGYGPVTITQAVTIEAPPGVTAFIHPPSGDAITVNAGSAAVVLRGLALNGAGSNNGITVNSVGTLIVENTSITRFQNGIEVLSGRINLKATDIAGSGTGVLILATTGLVQASLDRCHLDGNILGFEAFSTAPGGSTTTAVSSTANHNGGSGGWVCGLGSSGQDVLNLEFCAGSENAGDGLLGDSTNAASAVRYSNCVFANNGGYGAEQAGSSVVQTRGNNTITGNTIAPTHGTIGSIPSL